MGAIAFFTEARGKTPKEAFERVVEETGYKVGCTGYTGTIAEKGSGGYVEIDFPTEMDPYEFANRLIDEDDDRIKDKWGPSGCLDISATPHAFKHEQFYEPSKTYLFFGWASS